MPGNRYRLQDLDAEDLGVFVTTGDGRSFRIEAVPPPVTLLVEIAHLESAAGIRHAFRAVGATKPVTLSPEDRALLLDLLEQWANRGTVDRLPRGIWDLRGALTVDMRCDSAN